MNVVDWRDVELPDLIQFRLIYEDMLPDLEGWQHRNGVRDLAKIDQEIEQRKDDERNRDND